MKFYVNFKKYHGFNPEPVIRVHDTGDDRVIGRDGKPKDRFMLCSVVPSGKYLRTNFMTKESLEREHCEIDRRIVDKRLLKALREWPLDLYLDWYEHGLYVPLAFV